MNKRLEKIIYPNKQFEDVFRDIDAKQIAIDVEPSMKGIVMTIANFYAFREKILEAIKQKYPELMRIVKSRSIYDYRTQYGMFWLLGIYEDTYGNRIKVIDYK